MFVPCDFSVSLVASRTAVSTSASFRVYAPVIGTSVPFGTPAERMRRFRAPGKYKNVSKACFGGTGKLRSRYTSQCWRTQSPNVLKEVPRGLVVQHALFDGLSTGLQKAWDIVRINGKLTEENMKVPMREIRRALLEADVSLPVVRAFVARVQATALGTKVTKGVSPDQQLVKVVYDELLKLLGTQRSDLNAGTLGPRVILLAGLQGVGKTTAAAKLAKRLVAGEERVLLVSVDIYRPAAIDQLGMLAEKVGADFRRVEPSEEPPKAAADAVAAARREGYGALIVDTAGRLQANEEMMEELRAIKKATSPTDTLLVVDAMTGQEAAQLTKAFNDAVELTGAILTKLDGDSRGGAALSVKAVSGKPIKFIGTGEKMDALEPFYPDRLASRILGMGDVLSLVEKAQAAIKEEDAQAMMKKMLSAKFDFTDFLKQYQAINKMGNVSNVMKMMPGMTNVDDKQLQEVEKKYSMYESIIQSMTREEKASPDLLAKSASRRRRIARGSGRTEQQVNELLATFTGMRLQMKTMSRMMAASGGMGSGGMDDDELMEAIAADVGAQCVPPGLVRRKRVKSAVTSKELVGASSRL